MERVERRGIPEAADQAALIAAATAWFWPFATANLTQSQDEGVEVAAAIQILDGRTLYTEIVQSVKLPVYFLAGLFRVFGARLVVARLFELAVCVALTLLVYRFVARRTDRWSGLATAVASAAWSLPFWNIAGWDWEGVLLAVVAASAFLRHLETGSRSGLVGAGAVCGALFYFQPDEGLLMAAGLSAVTLLRWAVERNPAREPARTPAGHCLALGAGFAGTVGVVAVAAGAAGFLGEMTRQMVTGPLGSFSFVGNLTIPFPVPPYDIPGEHWWYGTDSQVWRVYLLPLAVLPLAVLAWLREAVHNDRRRWEDAVVLVTGVVVFLQVFPRSDVHHYVFALTGLFILSAWTLHRFGEAAGGPATGASRAAFKVALVLPLLVIAADGAAKAMPALRGPFVRSSFPALAGIRIPADREEQLRGVAAFLQSQGLRTGDEVLVLPADPILYFVLGTKNPTRYNCIDPGQHDESDEREVIGTLERKRLEWIVFRTDGEAFERYAPVLAPYVADRYAQVASFGPYAVLRRAEAGT